MLCVESFCLGVASAGVKTRFCIIMNIAFGVWCVWAPVEDGVHATSFLFGLFCSVFSVVVWFGLVLSQTFRRGCRTVLEASF